MTVTGPGVRIPLSPPPPAEALAKAGFAFIAFNLNSRGLRRTRSATEFQTFTEVLKDLFRIFGEVYCLRITIAVEGQKVLAFSSCLFKFNSCTMFIYYTVMTAYATPDVQKI